jgi:hypothetical protein
MANKKISELTAKAAQLQDDDLIMVSDYNGATYDTKSVTGANIRPYKTILFNVTQTSTTAPSKNFSYETEVSQTFTFTRVSAGKYRLTASSALFTSNKTFIQITGGDNPQLYNAYVVSTTVIQFEAFDNTTYGYVDDSYTGANLEIKIIK